MVATPYATLYPTGQKMPIVGMGTWKLDTKEAADTIYQAVRNGYRQFDGACDYGNEKECGDGLQRAFKDGLVKREEVFITSKLWNTFHAKKDVLPICKKQLADWGLEYFDLYLVHFPIALEYVDPKVRYPPGWMYDGKNDVRIAKVPFQETWQAMEALVDAGLVKAIGVSNMQGGLLLDLLRYARIPPSVLQIEHHPYLVQEELVRLAQSQKITVMAYSSFGPFSFRELDWKRANECQLLFEHPVITAIAKKHNRTAAEVLLRWSTQQGVIVIPKATDPVLVQQNLNHIHFNLAKEELQAITDLDVHMRFNNPADYFAEHKLLYLFA